MSRPLSIKSKETIMAIDEAPAILVQRFNFNPNLGTEKVMELGNDEAVEIVPNDIVTNNISFDTNDWGIVDLFGMLVGAKPGTFNNATFGKDSLPSQSAYGNIMIYENQDDGTLIQSTLLPAAKIQSFTWTYDARAFATESYNLMAREDYSFVGAYAETFVFLGTYSSSTEFTISDTDLVTADGLLLVINGVVYDSSYISSIATGTVTVTGITLAATDKIALIANKASAVLNMLDHTGIGGLRGRSIKVELKIESETAEEFIRLQNVTINGTVDQTELAELSGGFLGYDYDDFSITVNATSLKTDLYEYARICGITTAEWSARDTTGQLWSILDGQNTNLTIIVHIYDDHTQTNEIKTVTVDKIKISDNGRSCDVPGRGEVTWAFDGDNFTYEGHGALGRLVDPAQELYTAL